MFCSECQSRTIPHTKTMITLNDSIRNQSQDDYGAARRGARGGGSPKRLLQSPNRLYKAPTDYTKPPKDYTKPQKGYRTHINIRISYDVPIIWVGRARVGGKPTVLTIKNTYQPSFPSWNILLPKNSLAQDATNELKSILSFLSGCCYFLPVLASGALLNVVILVIQIADMGSISHYPQL